MESPIVVGGQLERQAPSRSCDASPKFAGGTTTCDHANSAVGPACTVSRPRAEFSPSRLVEFAQSGGLSWGPSIMVVPGMDPLSPKSTTGGFVINVLVIGDDRGTLATFGSVLRRAGFEVALAITGQEGLRLARQRRIDLVLADFRLPDMTGLEMLRQFRHEFLGTPFVLMTGSNSTASRVEAESLGATECVEKPVFADHLLDLVMCHLPLPSHSTSAEAGSSARANPQVTHALRLIEDRHREANLRVRSVAHDLGVSTEHLCRLLKRETGHTFVALLRDARVSAACHLLRATTLSMKQIADQVGFGSASRFDRDFKKVCAVSPSVYRIEALRQPRPFTQTSISGK